MQDMHQGYLTANGLSFHYLDWEGEGPDLIMVHPTGFVANIWQPFAELLKDRFHVVAFDARGHGDSDKPSDDYGWPSFAEDLRAFIAAAGLQMPVAVGHSAGATAIIVVEAQHPGSFRSAVLMEPILFYGPPRRDFSLEGNPMAAGTLKRRAVWPDRATVYESYSSRPPFQNWDPELLRLYIEHGFGTLPDGSVHLKCPPRTEALMYLWGPSPLPAAEFVARLRCPALLINGEQSTAFTPEDARRTGELLPNCCQLTLPGGHFAPFEHPRQAGEAIDAFLSEQLDSDQLGAGAGPT